MSSSRRQCAGAEGSVFERQGDAVADGDQATRDARIVARLEIGARSATVSGSFFAGSPTAPLHSVLSNAIRPPGRNNVRHTL
jgi:hypothetical protein